MKKWSESDEARNKSVTRSEYEEKGPEWFKDHAWGNRCLG